VLVSDSRKLVFVHIQKTGGITVHKLLREHIPDLHTILARHAFASRAMEELDNWDEYFKFAFVRNPWDRLVSWHSMIRDAEETEQKPWHRLRRYVLDNSSTFEEFIRNCTDEVEIKEGIRYSFAYNQLDYVTDEEGGLLVDFIGRVENFETDIRKVLDRIDIGQRAIPHENRSSHKHYSEMYTPDTEMIVRERFKRDIEYFGYEFERPHTALGAESTEKVSVGPTHREQRRIEVGVNGGPQETGAEIQAGRTPNDELPGKPGLLFVCGCDRSGTTALADYLNQHPEILVSQERSKATQQGDITLDLPTFERMLDFGHEETGDSGPDNGGECLIKPRAELLANRDPARLRWIGASNSGYMRHMESVAGNNPGARFIVMYRPVEEVAESWESKDADDHQNSNNGLERAVKTWNRSLQCTRRFIRDSVVPRVLLVSYHDFLYRTETVVPQISRFLELEFDESVTVDFADETLWSEKEKPGEPPGREKRSLIEKHANRAAEAWILDRIEKQWEEPGLYTQRTSKAALATSLDEAEARTWRLLLKVKELERDRERRRRRFKQLQNSRTWRLLNRISGIRSRIAGR
jgi:hypothetical protein